MGLLLACVLAGALLALMRNWFAVGLASLLFSVGAGVYEWRTGAGLTMALSMAFAACVALQASFLASSVIYTALTPPPPLSLAQQQDEAREEQGLDEAQLPPQANRNDRRNADRAPLPFPNERRNREPDI